MTVNNPRQLKFDCVGQVAVCGLDSFVFVVSFAFLEELFGFFV